tara:strand:+ start:727 stop:2394 length:1668 start_codon:yes stop_codon:yes gene_type:complete
LTQFLLGFYRHNHQIISVYSDSPFFKDDRFSDGYRAIINPVTFSKTRSEWLTIPNIYSSHPLLDEILNQQRVFHTSPNPDDSDQLVGDYSIGVLMHVPIHDPSMARTGVLVFQKEGVWEPVIVHFKDQPYIVECKGVGSGIGGYSSVHSRTQAGTTKTHERVTGGMLKPSMEKEFENLLRINSFYDFTLDSILPLACIGFEYSNSDHAFPLGLMLRLTPSNIRCSYSQFGEFNQHKMVPGQVYSIFSTINDQLFKAGYRHQNLNSNNLCFLKPGHFVITDYEEMDSIYQSPASLDSETDSLPMYLKVYPFRYTHQADYSTADCHQFYAPKYAHQEIQCSFNLSHATLREYYHASASFLGSEYFNGSLVSWVTDYLKPLLKSQYDCLVDCKDEVMANGSTKDLITSYMEAFDLNRQQEHGIGEFRMKSSLSVFFVLPIDLGLSEINRRIRHLESLFRHIDYLVRHDAFFNVRSNYQTPFLLISDVIDYWDIHLLMFPFLQWVSHWRYFLEANYGQLNAPLVNRLVERLCNDLINPKDLYVNFISSKDAFISYITKP